MAICYADIFKYPLTAGEVDYWQIAGGENFEVKIRKKDGYYFLAGKEGLVKGRLKRKKESEKKLVFARRIVKIISYLPSVLLVGVSGNLALLNAKKNDDIDLFIVTSSGTLWTTRFLLNFILDIFQLRRKPNDRKIKDKICLNLFLDEEYLVFGKPDQNLFIAHEILQMRPIIIKGDIYKRFLAANSWIEKYLPVVYEDRLKKADSKRVKSNFFWEKTFKLFNNLAYKLQIFIMKGKKTIEKVETGVIKFHPKDRKKWVLAEYNKRKKIKR